jgi:hypothetical protein
VYKRFTNRPLWQRVIALVVAYAVVLSSLFVGVGSARIAAAVASGMSGVICHANPDEPSPAGDKNTDKLWGDCCSVGCLMLIAGMPPPTQAVGRAQSSGHRLQPLATLVLGIGYGLESYRSRAPPEG